MIRRLTVNDIPTGPGSTGHTLGYVRAQLLQTRVIDIDPEWDLSRWREASQELREKGSLIVESTRRRKDGTILPVEISASYSGYKGAALQPDTRARYHRAQADGSAANLSV